MEKIGGVANGTLSGRASDLTSPTYKNCEAIAAAFEIPVHIVLQQAGILPNYDISEITEIGYLMQQLSADAQQSVLDYARFLLRPDSAELPVTIKPANELEQTILAHLQGMDEEFQETILKTIRLWRGHEELKRGKNKETR